MAGQTRRAYELFVSYIPWTVASRELKTYFSQFGVIKRCLLPFDKETGFHKGYSWISFTSEEGLQNALQRGTHILDGAKIQVNTQKNSSNRKGD